MTKLKGNLKAAVVMHPVVVEVSKGIKQRMYVLNFDKRSVLKLSRLLEIVKP